MLCKITPTLFLALLISQPALAAENYSKELNECYQEFNSQVDKISPLQENSEGPLKPADKSLVQGCANALRSSARIVKTHLERILQNSPRDKDASVMDGDYDCNLRRVFLNDMAKNLEAFQDRELDALVAATASTSRKFNPQSRMLFYKDYYSQSTAKRLEKNPNLIMPVSKKEQDLEHSVQSSIKLCSNNEMAAQNSKATHAQYKEIVKLQSIYDVGNFHDKTTGFEYCLRKKISKPLMAKTENQQKIHDTLAERNKGVGCGPVSGTQAQIP